MSESIAFNMTLFRELSDELGEADTLEVLKTFLADTANKMKTLQASCGDRGILKREAHSIKSSSATFGFHQLAQLARELERDSETIPAARLQQVIDQIHEAYEAAARFAHSELLTGELRTA